MVSYRRRLVHVHHGAATLGSVFAGRWHLACGWCRRPRICAGDTGVHRFL